MDSASPTSIEPDRSLSDRDMASALAARALLVQSMRMAAGLAALKVVAGAASGSLGVLASALDSVLDISASAVNYVSLDVSRRLPDDGHPYGHGKAEALAGLFQGAFIAASGLALLAESARRLWAGATVDAGPVAVGAMAVSLVASAVHARRLGRAARAGGSTVMRTENAHFSMDVWSNGAILAALAAVRASGSPVWDLLLSAAVTFYILKQAARILIECVNELMDHSLSAPVLSELREAVRGHHPAVVGFHDFRARKAGGQVFIDFHLEIRDNVSFREAHEITETLIDRLKTIVPGADITAHYDPEGGR